MFASITHRERSMVMYFGRYVEARLRKHANMRACKMEEAFRLCINDAPLQRIHFDLRAVVQPICVEFRSVPAMRPQERPGLENADADADRLSVIDLGAVVQGAWEMPFADVWMRNPMECSVRLVAGLPHWAALLFKLLPMQTFVLAPGECRRMRIQPLKQILDIRKGDSVEQLPVVRIGVGSSVESSIKCLVVRMRFVQAHVVLRDSADRPGAADYADGRGGGGSNSGSNSDTDGDFVEARAAAAQSRELHDLSMTLESPAPKEGNFWIHNLSNGAGVRFRLSVEKAATRVAVRLHPGAECVDLK
jgi:hypothetical protein